MTSTVNAKSIVLEILSAWPALHEGPIPVRMLVQAASIFDVAENSLRVTLVRLRSERLVDSPIRGHYMLGAAALPIQAQISRWRSLPEQVKAWDSAWIAAFISGIPRGDRTAQAKRLRALRLLGMRELRPGLFVRPNNLAIGVHGTRDWLNKLGLEKEAVICKIDQLEPSEQEQVIQLWDTKTMEAVYRDMSEQLEASLIHLDHSPIEAALRQAHNLAREGIRWLALDPLLPEAMVSVDARDALVKILMRHMDKTYQRWRQYLGISVPHSGSKVISIAAGR